MIIIYVTFESEINGVVFDTYSIQLFWIIMMMINDKNDQWASFIFHNHDFLLSYWKNIKGEWEKWNLNIYVQWEI